MDPPSPSEPVPSVEGDSALLPAVAPSVLEPKPAGIPAKIIQRMLLVSRDTQVVELIGRCLSPYCVDLRIAEGAAEAVEILAAHRDRKIILIDLAAPDETMILLKTIRHEEDFAYVILLTRNQSRTFRARYLDAGADDVLVIPFLLEVLLQRLRVAQRIVTLEEKLAQRNAIIISNQSKIARHAGMAEVATGVLHNVGNVLNSVNVSATILIESLTRLGLDDIVRISALLRDRDNEFGGLLAPGGAGERLGGFLDLWAAAHAAEIAHAQDELQGLRRSVDHIKEIVSLQQTYATSSGLFETIDVVELAEDALRMNAAALARHGIEIVRDYAFRQAVEIDKHKVLLILVNLVANAKYAIAEHGAAERILTIRTALAADRFRIVVEDTGVGIPAENLRRIFAHGFTTRAGGHGFGLHSSALAAQEMLGNLTARSDGLGRGAAFALELPLHRKKP